MTLDAGPSRPDAARMDDETAARPIDSTPWPEARPPHFPDRVTRIPVRVWPFLLVAAVIALHGWNLWSRATTFTPLDVLGDTGPAVLAALFGAALFLRHPDAHRALPLVTAGVVLFAAHELMRIAAPLADDALTAVFPPNPDGLKPFMPHEYVYAWLTMLALAAATALTGRGLDAARQFGEVVPRRAIGAILGLVAILLTARGAALFLNSPESSVDGVLTTIGFVINLIVTLGWVYLFTVAFGGWIAGERPRLGWGLAALGAGLYLVFDLFVRAADVVGPIGLTIPVLTYQLAWLALLLAFVVGLPSTTSDRPAAKTPGSAGG